MPTSVSSTRVRLRLLKYLVAVLFPLPLGPLHRLIANVARTLQTLDFLECGMMDSQISVFLCSCPQPMFPIHWHQFLWQKNLQACPEFWTTQEAAKDDSGAIPHLSGLLSCRGFVFRAQFRQLCSEFMDTIRVISPRRSFLPQESVQHVKDAVWKSSRKDSVCSEEENVTSCPLP